MEPTSWLSSKQTDRQTCRLFLELNNVKSRDTHGSLSLIVLLMVQFGSSAKFLLQSGFQSERGHEWLIGNKFIFTAAAEIDSDLGPTSGI